MPLNQAARISREEETEKEIVLKSRRVLTPLGLREASVAVRGGVIAEVGEAAAGGGAAVTDFGDDFLLPGLIELHTDNLERHLMPRPGIYWSDGLGALEAHDAEMAASGVTTVYDSICAGESVDKGREQMLKSSLSAWASGKGALRARHLLHIRCEISDRDMGRLFDEALEYAKPDLLSVMDHTPWQRQWRELSDWARYNRKIADPEELRKDALKIKEIRDSVADLNIQKVVGCAREYGIPLATHDDTEVSHIAEALAQGAVISEFPTTLEAAEAAFKAGLTVIMGAPNLIRGRSHSGNVLASDVAKAGHLSCLSSDYVPSSLIQGAFLLWQKHGMGFEEAMAAVTANPAKAAKLHDRGSVAPGLKADLIRVSLKNSRPRIEAVWVGGNRVF
jgi:alpha-D-ribose 1-methylphosphonate 5-triphosphate diphosphatase